MTEVASQPETVPRAALYIDGFNLYHPVLKLGENHLKWADLWRLGEIICERGGQKLVKVVFCTAVPKVERDAGKHERHTRFNSALKAKRVEIITGHHIPEADEETGEVRWREKQTDINLAFAIVFDGLENKYDVAFVLSADSDQVATARVFSERVAPLGKRMIGVAPPGRKIPVGYGQYGVTGFSLTKLDIERCVMPALIEGPDWPITRPPEYDPPADWMHPNDRPKNKPPKAPKKWSKPTKMRGNRDG